MYVQKLNQNAVSNKHLEGEIPQNYENRSKRDVSPDIADQT